VRGIRLREFESLKRTHPVRWGRKLRGGPLKEGHLYIDSQLRIVSFSLYDCLICELFTQHALMMPIVWLLLRGNCAKNLWNSRSEWLLFFADTGLIIQTVISLSGGATARADLSHIYAIVIKETAPITASRSWNRKWNICIFLRDNRFGWCGVPSGAAAAAAATHERYASGSGGRDHFSKWALDTHCAAVLLRLMVIMGPQGHACRFGN
jgi:hypothetical protein